MGVGHFWAIVLASSGSVTPSSFRRTIERAIRFVPLQRIIVVVAPENRERLQAELGDPSAVQVIEEPAHRGTAPRILLAFLHVLWRDPMARVLVLPADQQVDDEVGLGASILDAIQAAHDRERRVVLLGMEPGSEQANHGWIVPAAPVPEGTSRGIAAFVDCPGEAKAAQLTRRGALWNSSILVAAESVLLRLFESAVPWLLEEFLAWRVEVGADPGALRLLYRTLPEADFTHEVLEHSRDLLAVVSTPHVGWRDLGPRQRTEPGRRGATRHTPFRVLN